LMRGYRHQVNPELHWINRNLAERLYGIDMKQHLRILCQYRSDLFDRLDRSYFIIDVHDADQHSVVTNRLFHLSRIDTSVLVDRKNGDLIPLRLKLPIHLVYGSVLNRRSDEMASSPLMLHQRAFNRQIIAF